MLQPIEDKAGAQRPVRYTSTKTTMEITVHIHTSPGIPSVHIYVN